MINESSLTPEQHIQRKQLEIQAHQTEIQRAQLKLTEGQHTIERRMAYLQEHHVNTTPYHERQKSQYNASIALALVALRSLYILAGGAAVALPTFSDFFGIQGESLFTPMLLLFLSLLSALVANILGYFSAQRGYIALDSRIEETVARTDTFYHGDDKSGSSKLRANQAAAAALKTQNQANNLEICAVFLVVLSLLLFVTAVVVASWSKISPIFC